MDEKKNISDKNGFTDTRSVYKWLYMYIFSNFFSNIISSASNLIANCDLQGRERERIAGATEGNYGDIDRKSAMSICNYWRREGERERDRRRGWKRSPPGTQKRREEDRGETQERDRGRGGQNGEALRDRNRPVGRRPLRSSHTEIHLKSSHYLNYWSF